MKIELLYQLCEYNYVFYKKYESIKSHLKTILNLVYLASFTLENSNVIIDVTYFYVNYVFVPSDAATTTISATQNHICTMNECALTIGILATTVISAIIRNMNHVFYFS